MTGKRWWLAIGTALALLVLLDQLLLLWRPHPARLPDQFSADYLRRYIDAARGVDPIVVVGDSVLWGYGIPAESAVPAILARRFAPRPVLNLSYEGGSPANADVLLRYLIARGVKPACVVLDLNPKVFNPADSAYRTLHPALARATADALDADDRRLLALPPGRDLNGRIETVADRAWRLYRWRVDLRSALFGAPDATSALTAFLQNLTGVTERTRAAHVPTADRFLATYDLTPVDTANVAFHYLGRSAALLERERIPVVVFATPTNHTLLHEYIDDPAYERNVRYELSAFRSVSGRVLDLDRAMPGAMFIDNDHLTPAGSERLAGVLAPAIASVLP